MQNNISTDKLVIEGRSKLSMTEVNSVDGFTSEVLNLTVVNTKVRVLGEKIKIIAFNKDSGNLVAEGVFNEIKYNVKKQPLLKRIFK